jgi:tetratricopeptide (TPR) repeat protein
MDAAMFAKFHQEEKAKPRPLTQIPEDQQDVFTLYFKPIWEAKKELYDDRSLLSFEQYEEKTRAEAEEAFLNECDQLSQAQIFLQEKFLEEEDKHPDIDEEAKFSAWEKAASIKENDEEMNFGTPWPFMDRAFQYAAKLVNNKNFEEAKAIYHFLRILNSEVFEYRFGEALCLQLLGEYEEAIDNYIIAYFLRPNMPLVLLRIANCYLALNEKEEAISALEDCLEKAKEEENNENKALEDEALLLLQKLQ